MTPGTLTKRRFQSSFASLCSALLLAACTTIKLPNTPVCAVAGTMSAGADCAYTLTDETYSLSFDEWIDYLEPQSDRPDPKAPGKTLPARGGALCLPSEGWAGFKTALEQACRKLGGRVCTAEVKAALLKTDERLTLLAAGASSKKTKRR